MRSFWDNFACAIDVVELPADDNRFSDRPRERLEGRAVEAWFMISFMLNFGADNVDGEGQVIGEVSILDASKLVKGVS